MRIDVRGSLSSGQAFLWEEDGGMWHVINGQDVLRIRGDGRTASHLGGRPDFFRRRDDMARILGSISRDRDVARAVRLSPGLRVLDQDPFQCLVTFIISANSNMPRIRSCLSRISARMGGRAEVGGREYRTFPTPARLARASPRDIAACGAGYRSPYVVAAARMVERGELDLARLRRAGYAEARAALLAVPGVGSKVADCVMLFSLCKLEAFPIDRWMARILGGRFGLGRGSLTPRQYGEAHGRLAAHFGPYAGYAQQFLFKAAGDARGASW
ncbi:MAG: DNA repair protein [Nitrosopumilus sp.]|nr:DNA repair protein [Nitrosopumilus sp.]MDA7958073.1 DNA repair protein [Nitrosopumilus sp.]